MNSGAALSIPFDGSSYCRRQAKQKRDAFPLKDGVLSQQRFLDMID